MPGPITNPMPPRNGDFAINGTNGHINGAVKGGQRVPKRLYAISQPPSLSEFKKLVSRTTDPSLYHHAADVVSNVPIYDIPSLPPLSDAEAINTIQDEWHHILLSGPGVFVLKGAFHQHQEQTSSPFLLKQVNEVFADIVQTESSLASGVKGDHFASSGSNSRIWNSFQKHALLSPSTFTKYYSNPYLSLAAESWLGPSYQITAQVNIVKPGGKPQVSHRDYHLGFQTAEQCSQFPRATQVASQFLTLQGAVAHSDMPLESGPTRFLPFSQMFEEGYMAYRLREFQDYFDANWVSVPLQTGDAVFFNPALFHAAGENTSTDIERSANLLQISSAFGKTMESIDTIAIIEKCWDDVRALYKEKGGMTEEVQAILKAIGRGYPFPTNLDQRPPEPGGMAPESELDTLRKAVQQDWDSSQVVSAISKISSDSLP